MAAESLLRCLIPDNGVVRDFVVIMELAILYDLNLDWFDSDPGWCIFDQTPSDRFKVFEHFDGIPDCNRIRSHISSGSSWAGT